MSKELRNISVAFTVNDYETTADYLGTGMYADDVVGELSEVIEAAVKEWYDCRGHMMLATEPTL